MPPDPRTATLAFIDERLKEAREAVTSWEQFRESVRKGAPLTGGPPGTLPRPPRSSTPPTNGHRPKLRDAVLAIFGGGPTRDYDLAEMTKEVSGYGFSKNAVRVVLYGLRDDKTLIAVRGEGAYSPTRYHLAPMKTA